MKLLQIEQWRKEHGLSTQDKSTEEDAQCVKPMFAVMPARPRTMMLPDTVEQPPQVPPKGSGGANAHDDTMSHDDERTAYFDLGGQYNFTDQDTCICHAAKDGTMSELEARIANPDNMVRTAREAQPPTNDRDVSATVDASNDRRNDTTTPPALDAVETTTSSAAPSAANHDTPSNDHDPPASDHYWRRDGLTVHVIHETEYQRDYAQYVELVSCKSKVVLAPDATPQYFAMRGPPRTENMADGILYAGARAFTHVESCAYLTTDRLHDSYITSAALRRSGCHWDRQADVPVTNRPAAHSRAMTQLQECDHLHNWLKGTEAPNSTTLGGCQVLVDECRFLDALQRKCKVKDIAFIVIPSNEMRVILGKTATQRLDHELDKTCNPMQQTTIEECRSDIREALLDLYAPVLRDMDLTPEVKEEVKNILYVKYARAWKAKYDLTEAAALPAMKIELRPGAEPSKIRRHYRWTPQQREFLRKLLRKLVDVGIISRTDSEWCCPVVLVLKPDLTWRLCVDPSELNKVTVPMKWPAPKPRELIQQSLSGMMWMCRFDFVSMFWQLALEEESRRLFSFYAGDLGTYQFNRVAMGALNSSAYTQRMLTRIFENAKRKDGRPLLGNGLMVQTDDVLLYASTQEEMVELLDLFMYTICCHQLAIHPGS